MTVYNLGSINIDHAYFVPHIPAPGETLAATEVTTGLGGKGANMSVAAARAAARVCHLGAIGGDGIWTRDRLLEYGVDTRHIHRTETPTGHAIIAVAEDGENSILLYTGANRCITGEMIGAALAEANTGDFLLMQNETNGTAEAAQLARRLGLRVAYAAAPFDADAVRILLPHIDMLVLNEVEAEQLSAASGKDACDLGVADVIVTLGADGCVWHSENGSERFAARKVTPVDTTGAGDTFTGYLIACLDRGQPMGQAIGTATKAAALMVTRHGTADVIPDLSEVQALD